MVAKMKYISDHFGKCYENQMEERVGHKLARMASLDNILVVGTQAGMATDNQHLEDNYRQQPA